MPPDEIPPEIRRLAERYEFLEELGRGGMAVVHLARERASGALVAIKFIGGRYTEDAEAVGRFAREARTVAGLRHPNIVRTLAIEELGGSALAIVTEYVPGETLRAALRADGPFAFERAAQVLRDVAAALAHAHERRIVHRDVKPENIFLAEDDGRALLADFGIARPIDGDTLLTAVGSSLGTPTYMSPEQVEGGAVDERTDVYALGLVGWELLTGRRPWQGETLYAVLYKQKHEELPDLAALRPDIPAFLLRAISGAVSKDPAARWRDAGEMLARLSPSPAALPAPLAPADAGMEDAPTTRISTRATAHDDAPATAAPAAGASDGLTSDDGVREREPIVVAASSVATSSTVAPNESSRDDATRVAEPVIARPDSGTHRIITRPRTAARRPARRWWPMAATAAAGVLALAVFLPRATRSTGRGDRPDDAALDSLLGAAQTTTAAVTTAPASTTPAAPPRTSTAAGEVRPPTTTPAPRSLDARCRSAANADQRACLLTQLERDDEGLTRAYVGLIRALRRQAGGSREPAAVRALRAEQRAWLVARDRECRTRMKPTEGAMWGAARAPCFAELSQQRAAELTARLARIGGAPRS